MTKIKNRIVGSGEEALDQIMFNPRNWRIHPLNQQDALKGVLEEVGWVQQVIINKRTGNLIDGHLRCQLAAREGATTIPVVYIDVSEEEEALILSTLDPIAGMAVTDKEKLSELFGQFSSENENVQALVNDIMRENGLIGDDQYTRKIVSPTYKPKNQKPTLDQLVNTKKADELIVEIENSSFLMDGEKEFLKNAAKRHDVFYYDKIADYYAHSTPEVQRLMEKSALVIIDFEKAIENGFVEFSHGIADLFEQDYG